MKTLLLITLLNTLSFGSDFIAHFYINGKKADMHDHTMVKAGEPTLVEVYYTEPTSKEVYKEFKIMHGKYMHMVLVSEDLKVFKHVHPYFDPITGRFSMVLNMPYNDFDNHDAVDATATPGHYMLMADVIIKGVGMRMGHTMVHIHKSSHHDHGHHHISSDLVKDEGTIKEFKRNPHDSEPTYKTHFSYKTIKGQAGQIVKFEIAMYKKIDGTYKEMMDFEPWLSEAAHAVWLSEGFMDYMHMGETMPFAHMHSSFALMDDEDDYRVYDHILRFNVHDLGQMKSGLQKMWIQIKDNGKVMKLPFIFKYEGLD